MRSIAFSQISAAVCALVLWSSAGAGAAAELSDAKSRKFGTPDGAPLHLHIFNPAGHQTSDTRPAILFFFGGGWDHGDPSQFVRHAAYFASRGMVAICPEYRTRKSHGTSPLECVADGKAAVRWVRAHARELGIDPQRIAASGGSAGGHVAASAAVLSDTGEADANPGVSSRPDALVLFNPVLDTTATGYGAKKLGARALEASPVHHVRTGLPPTIIFHGKADTTAPFENSKRFAGEMQKAGNPCTLLGYDGQRHGFYWKEPFYSATIRAADRFLTGLGWLTGEPTLPETSATQNPGP